MTLGNNEETLRLHPSPVDRRPAVFVCGLGAAAGILMALTGHDVLVISGIILAGCFGPVAFLCTLGPRPGQTYLELTPEVVHERSFLASRTYRWQDIEWFEFVSDTEAGDEVGYVFSNAYRGPRPLNFFGIRGRLDGRLLDTYGLPARDLADLLNGWRARYSPGPTPAAERPHGLT